jgi:hypothetical protein
MVCYDQITCNEKRKHNLNENLTHEISLREITLLSAERCVHLRASLAEGEGCSLSRGARGR